MSDFRIQEYLSTTKERVELKEYNILIPICLGNRFFMERNSVTKNVEVYINWALDHTKNKVVVLVVDKIQDTNYYVRHSNKTKKASLRNVLKAGKEIKDSLEKLVSQFPKSRQNKIEIIQWEEYEQTDSFFYSTVQLVYKEFKDNEHFKNRVLHAVKTSVVDRKFSEEQYLKLCEYVLDEFSVAYSGVEYNNEYYGLYIYPETDSVVHFIEEIKRGEIFKSLHDKLPKEKIALAILN